VVPRNSPHLSTSQFVAPILRYIAIWERPSGGKSQLSGEMAKDGEKPRVLAPEVRDMCIDDALEEVWDTVGARQGSKRSKVFIVHFDNRKSKECHQ
jgi:ribosomal protein L20A (L18A)